MKNNNSEWIEIALMVLVIILLFVASLGITMLLVRGACWCFGWTYSHKMALGVWLITILAKNIFTVKVKSK